MANRKKINSAINFIKFMIGDIDSTVHYNDDILLPNNFIKKYGGNNLELIAEELFNRKIAIIHTAACSDGSIILSITLWRNLGSRNSIKKGYKIKYFKNNDRLNVSSDIIETIYNGYKLIEFTPLIYHSSKRLCNNGWIIFYIKEK